jgi:hypothetical protein
MNLRGGIPDKQAIQPGWWAENGRRVGQGASNLASGFLGVAPHLANINAYNNMAGVPAANLASTVQTRAPNMDAGRQAILAQGRNASQRASGGSPSDQMAANIAAMGGTQSALSRYSGQEAQVQAQNDARNAQAVNQTNARNVGILNRQQTQEQARDLAQMRGIGKERGNISNKSLGFIGDLNNQRLDRDKMDLMYANYNRNGTLDRAAQKQYEEQYTLPEFYRKKKTK